MASTVVARRYARALFEASRDAGELDTVVSELETFARALDDSPELLGILTTPALPLDDRQGLLRDVLERAKASRLTTNALLLLTELGRLPLLPEITEAFREEADRAAGRVRARVTSAAELAPAELAEVKTVLEHATGKSVVVESAVDPELIGGVVASIGGVVYDGSLKSQLRRLRAAIAQEQAGEAA